MIIESEKFKAPVSVELKDEKEYKIFPDSPDESEEAVRERVLQIYLSSYPSWAVLRHLGYMEINVSVVEKTQVTSNGFAQRTPWILKIELTLTQKGRELAGAEGLSGYKEVPIARREIIEVTGIRQREGQAVADFTWKTVPNEAGRAFDPASDTFKSLPKELQDALTESRGVGPFGGNAIIDWSKTYNSTASFQKYDNGWRLTAISSGIF